MNFFSIRLLGRMTCLAVISGLSVMPLPAQNLSGLVPANPQPRTDKHGNDWRMEQNGQLGSSGNGNAALNGGMMLIIGNDQFYCNQPMGTPDGKEMVFMGQQPMMGVQVTRYVRFLEKEGGFRYLDVFANPGANDVSLTVEIRNSFGGQLKEVITDVGRTHDGTLAKGESGLLVKPASGAQKAVLFTVSTPGSDLKPRVAIQQRYQLSYFYPIVVPAGKSVGLMHLVAQQRLSPRPDQSELEKAFKPLALSRHQKDLPKGASPLVLNLRGGSSGGLDLGAWFPDEVLGVKREQVDVLALGEQTRLRGRASCARLVLHHRFGDITVPWDKVVAITGGRYRAGDSLVFLDDGQVLRGRIEAEELKFVMTSGLQMTLNLMDLDRLVVATQTQEPTWPKEVAALVETGSGERLALKDDKDFQLTLFTPWGTRDLQIGELVAMTVQDEDDQSRVPLLTLKDGSQLRAWLGEQKTAKMNTTLFGQKDLAGLQLRALAVRPPENRNADLETAESTVPSTSYAELAGNQRIAATLTEQQIKIVTPGGLVLLEPGSIKEMRNVSEEISDASGEEGTWFHIDLWGGGTVMGQFDHGSLSFNVASQTWRVPPHELLRVGNPQPKISESALFQVSRLIRELGHDDWKIREKATGELKTMGELARPAMQEAVKQSEDAEVKRRIELILGSLD